MLLISRPFNKSFDERRTLIEISRGEWKQVNLLKIRKGKIVGGHYHKNKTELFYVISGLVVFTIATQDRIGTHVVQTDEMIQVDPLEQHTLIACEDSVLVELMTTEFDEKNVFKYGEE